MRCAEEREGEGEEQDERRDNRDRDVEVVMGERGGFDGERIEPTMLHHGRRACSISCEALANASATPHADASCSIPDLQYNIC